MTAQEADILAQRPRRLGIARRLAFAFLIVCAPPLAVVTAFGIAPGTAPSEDEIKVVREAIELPETLPVTEQAPRYVSQERVLTGDTVAALFDRLGVSDPKAIEFLKADAKGRALFRQLVPGRMIQAERGDSGDLLALRYFMSPTSMLEVMRTQEGLKATQRAVADAPRLVYKSATIRSSLFAATDAAGIPDAIAMQLARVFATDIDFHTDLRRGDRFSVVYEMIYDSGELIAPGRILAAEFVNDGRPYEAILFTDEEGIDGYFSLDGTNRAKAFLRSPVEFSRVSSGFGARFHPIFKNWRAHTGVDFAAPKGTRVLATADGQVLSAGARGGYGNAIEIRHGSGITTLYGHLSAFAAGIRSGTRVHQGEVIGYVGMTGFATGPHLHYEFKLAGIHQDPLRVALPKADPVPARLKAQFLQVANRARTTIDLVSTASAARFE
ncbi:MAG: peptidoglycan DD-metalloendopeptidase family protein [Usitatibacter sp.]